LNAPCRLFDAPSFRRSCLADLRALLARPDPFQRALGALLAVDGARLLAAFVDRKRQTAIGELLVQIHRRGGKDRHHRAGDVVLVRDQLAGGRILAGGRNRQLALGLQQLQRVGGARGALFLGDGENLVPQILLAHVEERLSGHCRVLHLLLLGNKSQHRVHQRRIAGGRARLDHHPERLF
jgi:hypothetical protein